MYRNLQLPEFENFDPRDMVAGDTFDTDEVLPGKPKYTVYMVLAERLPQMQFTKPEDACQIFIIQSTISVQLHGRQLPLPVFQAVTSWDGDWEGCVPCDPNPMQAMALELQRLREILENTTQR